MILLLFWTTIIAPFVVARCQHPSGDSHLHAQGAVCEAHAPCNALHGQGTEESPADFHGTEHAPHGNCSAYAGDPLTPSDAAARPAPPVEFAPLFAALIVVFAQSSGEPPLPRVHESCAAPPRETHGRGALPLLI